MQVDNQNKKQKYVSLRDILYFAQTNYNLQWVFFRGFIFFSFFLFFPFAHLLVR